ncbi:MAG: four helix bundle protein [Candidatus Roizmanbacteria bacterium]
MAGMTKEILLKRTQSLASEVILLSQKIVPSHINKRMISQVIASAGSIGANYCEAIEAESKKDFIHKLSLSKKEIKETLHWLYLLSVAHPEHSIQIEGIKDEVRQLLLIFSKSISTLKNKSAIK